MSKIATETGNRLIDTRRNRLRALPHRRGPVLRPALAPRLQRLRVVVHLERTLRELRRLGKEVRVERGHPAVAGGHRAAEVVAAALADEELRAAEVPLEIGRAHV